MEKQILKVGDKGYLRQFTGNSWVDMVKHPYTVISVTPSKVIVQECRLVYPVFHYDPKTMSDYYKQFDGRRVNFYDTIAESIEPDSTGRTQELTWHAKRGMWGTEGRDADYPQYFIEGNYQHQPYLD